MRSKTYLLMVSAVLHNSVVPNRDDLTDRTNTLLLLTSCCSGSPFCWWRLFGSYWLLLSAQRLLIANVLVVRSCFCCWRPYCLILAALLLLTSLCSWQWPHCLLLPASIFSKNPCFSWRPCWRSCVAFIPAVVCGTAVGGWSCYCCHPCCYWRHCCCLHTAVACILLFLASF